MRVLIALLGLLALVAAEPKNPQRIVGGSLTTINQYPDMVSLLWSFWGSNHLQNCGGSILTNRAILTAAHCTIGDHAFMWQSRVGSTFANSGGVVHATSHIINHPQYNPTIYDNDVAIIRTAANINFVNNLIQQASIAGSNYVLLDNQVVWATGWGRQYSGGPPSEQLRHVQIWTVNQALCRARYAEIRGFPEKETKIVGGASTTISRYPQVSSLLYSYVGTNYRQSCGGTILNTRSVLTAAHCVRGDSTSRWRIRTGSTYANSGGTVYNVGDIIVHSYYNTSSNDNDVAILRSAASISYSSLVQAGLIAGSSYYLADNQPVWAVGWGSISPGGPTSENLLHVQIWSVNQSVCKKRYSEIRRSITDNMLCSGWLDVGSRDQCQGDSGGPLFHNGVVVGICSWGQSCALAKYPGVNTRVSRFTVWIQINA